MIHPGERQTLVIARHKEFGDYLEDPDDPKDAIDADFKKQTGRGTRGTAKTANGPGGRTRIREVLLPAKEVPEGARNGDRIEVFVYFDSEDRPIATTVMPPLTIGGFAPLTVREVTRVGAFLDWGLPKDLFLPYKEMSGHPKAGDTVLVRLYLDKSSRLAASMRGIYPLLSTNSPYQREDEVTGRIYEFGHDFGVFVAVDDRYSGMIPKYEDRSDLRIGEVITCRVTGVKEDGKLDLSLRDKAYRQMNEDAEALLSLLDSYAGVFPFTEKASPEVIQRETGLSKAAFKRAIGHLYKEHRISLADGKIRKL